MRGARSLGKGPHGEQVGDGTSTGDEDDEADEGEADEDEVDEEEPRVKDAVLEAFWLTGKVMSASALALPGLFFTYAPSLLNKHRAMWRVDTSIAEPVVLPASATFWQFQSAKMGFDVPWFFFLPLVYSVMLRLNRVSVAKLMGGVVVTLACNKAAQLTFGTTSMLSLLTSPLPTGALMLFLLAKFRHQPHNARVPWTALPMIVALMIGVLFSRVLSSWTLDTQSSRMVFVLVFVPALRELTFVLIRFPGLYLWRHNFGFQVRRWAVMFIFWWLQMFWAIYVRTFLTNLAKGAGGRSELTLVVALQTVLEISLRLTLLQRRRLSSALWERVRCRKRRGIRKPGTLRRGSVAVVPNFASRTSDMLKSSAIAGTRSRVSSHPMLVKRAEHSFYSTWLVGETLAEYMAIFTVPVTLVACQDHKLHYPFEYYNAMEDPFRSRVDVMDLVKDGLLQLAGEILADVTCTTVEICRGMRMQEFWKTRPPAFFAMLILAAWHGTGLIAGFMGGTTNFVGCYGKDVCMCSVLNNGTGLPKNGLLERYCVYTRLYEETSGTVGDY